MEKERVVSVRLPAALVRELETTGGVEQGPHSSALRSGRDGSDGATESGPNRLRLSRRQKTRRKAEAEALRADATRSSSRSVRPPVLSYTPRSI